MSRPAVVLPLGPDVDEASVAGALDDHAWYHRIGIGSLVTPGLERYEAFQRPVLDGLWGLDVDGRRVLDVGCRDGLMAFAAEQQGAAEVVAIDNNLSTGAAEVLVPASGSAVRFEERNLLATTPEAVGGPFDVVVAAGLLYHLREPFAGLRALAHLVTDGGVLLLETALWLGSGRFADLWCPVGPDGPYDATSPSFFNPKGLRDVLRAVGFAVETWQLLDVPQRHPPGRRARLLRRQRVVDRVTVRCRRDAATVDPALDAYWYGTHTTRRWT